MDKDFFSDELKAKLTASPEIANTALLHVKQIAEHPGWQLMQECLTHFREQLIMKMKVVEDKEKLEIIHKLTAIDLMRDLPKDLVIGMEMIIAPNSAGNGNADFGYVEPSQGQ